MARSTIIVRCAPSSRPRVTRFRTESDTEVLLQLYAERGPAMVEALRGMFAFGLWDARRRRLLLARDPLGIKPLYYADDGWTVRFASQAKALLAGGAVSRDPDPAGIVGFHLLGSVPEPFTVWREIRALPAGTTDHGRRDRSRCAAALLRRGPLACPSRRNRGWRRHPAHQRAECGAARFSAPSSGCRRAGRGVPVGRPRFGRAARHHGRARRARRHRRSRWPSSEFRGAPLDEAPLAAEVAARYGARHVVRTVDRAEFERDLPAILDAMDLPTIDGINTWFVAKAAREAGIKVALSGLGADECFGGYPSFADVPRSVTAASALRFLPGARRARPARAVGG